MTVPDVDKLCSQALSLYSEMLNKEENEGNKWLGVGHKVSAFMAKNIDSNDSGGKMKKRSVICWNCGEARHTCNQCNKPKNEAKQAEGNSGQHQEHDHKYGMRYLDIHEQVGSCENDRSEYD